MQVKVQRCLYQITVQDGKSVEINFLVFSEPYPSICYFNYLRIYEDRVGYNSNLKASFCATGSRTFQSYSNRVIVEFKSVAISMKRFYATYSTINKGI